MSEQKRIPVTFIFGSLAGLGMILITFSHYKGGPQTFISGTVYLMYLLPLALAPAAALVERNRSGGTLGFRAALRICFGVIVLALALNTAFTWVLLHVIDPAFNRGLRPVMLARREANYRRFGASEDEIRKFTADQKDSDDFSLGSMVGGLVLYYIPGFLIALLLATLVKRNKPAGGKA